MPYLQWPERQGKPSKKWERSASRIAAQTTSCSDWKRTSHWRTYYRVMITRAMRDWNEPVRTYQIIEYQQIVNSTFTKWVLFRVTHTSYGLKDVRQRKMTSVIAMSDFIGINMTSPLRRTYVISIKLKYNNIVRKNTQLTIIGVAQSGIKTTDPTPFSLSQCPAVPPNLPQETKLNLIILSIWTLTISILIDW